MREPESSILNSHGTRAMDSVHLCHHYRGTNIIVHTSTIILYYFTFYVLFIDGHGEYK
jgi:hypothetical protein